MNRPSAWMSAVLVAATTVLGAEVSSRAEAPPGAEAIAEAVGRARAWSGAFASEEVLEPFAPSVDLRYREYRTPRPLRAWIARIDLAAPGVRLVVTEPADLPDEDGSLRETRCADTLQFARQRGVQLAFNASAFAPFRKRMGQPMDVVGFAAFRGETYSSPDDRFGAMYVSRDGRVSLQGPPLAQANLWQVIPGFRMLLDDGRVVVQPKVAASKFGQLNPRTAVGTDREGKRLWVVVVDGRQAGVSEGITLVELAVLFESLGAWDALNLDGGGSSTLVAENADGTHGVLNKSASRGAVPALRQVAVNVGVHLPHAGLRPKSESVATLRDAVIRLARTRRGGGYKWAGHGVSKDIKYDGHTLLRTNPEGSFCCGATLETFLDAYSIMRYGSDCAGRSGRWFQDWPLERMQALQRGWWGTEEAPTDPHLPAECGATIREKQVYHVLPWAGFGEPVERYQQLQRGDFVQFWRRSGSGHSVIFWGRDRDEQGRERLWYWSSQPRPRYAYPVEAGGPAVKTPGYGLNWEYIGEEIDPQRIYGVRVKAAAGALGSSSKL